MLFVVIIIVTSQSIVSKYDGFYQVKWRSSGDTNDKAVKVVPSRRGRMWACMMSGSNLQKIFILMVIDG